MNVDLHDLLADRAESVEAPVLDPRAVVARGERLVRRRNRLAAAGAALSLAFAVGTTALVLSHEGDRAMPARDPSPVGPAPGPNQSPATGSRPLSYGERQVIHLGERQVDTGVDYLSLDITDDGAAFTTLDGKIWFTDGTGTEQIGATVGGTVHGESTSWDAGRPPDWVLNDSAGSLLAWLEYPNRDLGRPELVVYDSAQRSVLRRAPVELSDQEAAVAASEAFAVSSVAAVAGREVFVLVRTWATGSDRRLVRYDVDSGSSEPVTATAYEAARRGVPRALVVGPSAQKGNLMSSMGGDAVSPGFAGWFPVGDSRLDELFDPHTGDRLDVRVPPRYNGSRLFFVQWLDNDRFALISDGPPSESPTGDLLTCRITAGRCTVTIQAASWAAAPLLPGMGGVGEELAQLRATG